MSGVCPGETVAMMGFVPLLVLHLSVTLSSGWLYTDVDVLKTKENNCKCWDAFFCNVVVVNPLIVEKAEETFEKVTLREDNITMEVFYDEFERVPGAGISGSWTADDGSPYAVEPCPKNTQDGKQFHRLIRQHIMKISLDPVFDTRKLKCCEGAKMCKRVDVNLNLFTQGARTGVYLEQNPLKSNLFQVGKADYYKFHSQKTLRGTIIKVYEGSGEKKLTLTSTGTDDISAVVTNRASQELVSIRKCDNEYMWKINQPNQGRSGRDGGRSSDRGQSSGEIARGFFVRGQDSEEENRGFRGQEKSSNRETGIFHGQGQIPDEETRGIPDQDTPISIVNRQAQIGNEETETFIGPGQGNRMGQMSDEETETFIGPGQGDRMVQISAEETETFIGPGHGQDRIFQDEEDVSAEKTRRFPGRGSGGFRGQGQSSAKGKGQSGGRGTGGVREQGQSSAKGTGGVRGQGQNSGRGTGGVREQGESSGRGTGGVQGQGQSSGRGTGGVRGQGQSGGRGTGGVRGQGQSSGRETGGVRGQGHSKGRGTGGVQGQGQSSGRGTGGVQGQGHSKGRGTGGVQGQGQSGGRGTGGVREQGESSGRETGGVRGQEQSSGRGTGGVQGEGQSSGRGTGGVREQGQSSGRETGGVRGQGQSSGKETGGFRGEGQISAGREPENDRADQGADTCYYHNKKYCKQSGNLQVGPPIRLSSRMPDTEAQNLCNTKCLETADCNFFTWMKKRGVGECYLLTECVENNKDSCLNNEPQTCMSGPKDCDPLPGNQDCPTLDRLGPSYTEWQCRDHLGNFVEAHDTDKIPWGTICIQACDSWVAMGSTLDNPIEAHLKSSCKQDGTWTNTEAYDGKGNLLYPVGTYTSVKNPGSSYPVPNDPIEVQMKCECAPLELKWPTTPELLNNPNGTYYNPNTELYGDFLCEYPVDMSSNQFNIYSNNSCVFFCGNYYQESIRCYDGDWTGRPQLGFWCQKEPGTKKGPKFVSED